MQTYKASILVVDDTLANLQLLMQTLSDSGYKVRMAPDGELALQSVRSNPPDLILLDIKMPGIDGYEVCRQLKLNPATHNIPIIFLSALDEPFDKVKAFECGGVDYINKPFQMSEVLARVKNQLTIGALQANLAVQNKNLKREVEERIEAEEQLQAANKQLQEAREIAEREARRAAAANQAKSDFLTSMSHELRTPLNTILGFADLLGEARELSQESQEMIDIIQRSGKHLLTLINDILSMSKIESGRTELHEDDFDLHLMLDDLHNMFLVKTHGKTVKLIFNRDRNLPHYVCGDQVKLRQVLINLIGNALKFTEIGSVTVRVESRQEVGEASGNGDRPACSTVYFAVEDTGCGIEPEEIESIFNPFSQASKGRQGQEGTGLGLSIAREFIHLMGGEIKVESEVDKGSRFGFEIPLRCLDSNLGRSSTISTVEKNQKIVGVMPGSPSYRILVVDDSRTNRQLLLKVIEPLGFQVREASDGEEALEIWEDWQPDLILMDVKMPKMNGKEATQRIRATPEGEKVKILGTTAIAFEEEKQEIQESGYNDIISKPLDKNLLYKKLAEYLNLEYCYEDFQKDNKNKRLQVRFTSSGKLDPNDALLLRSELANMPKAWRDRLYNAVTTLNENMVLNLIEELPECNFNCKDILGHLVTEIRLDLIFELLQDDIV
ncbi:MAG: hybrid sensor histidine kinase/response regulator [Cyanobacteria bacterium J007]|nr:MAG: hybrid sensor histidine kinase/response regulator [Cyanobacteria bacterium J007]